LEAKLKEKDVKAIAIAIGPGMEYCINEGIDFAQKLSESLKVPLIPVSHTEAHIFTGRL